VALEIVLRVFLSACFDCDRVTCYGFQNNQAFAHQLDADQHISIRAEGWNNALFVVPNDCDFMDAELRDIATGEQNYLVVVLRQAQLFNDASRQ
jgi:hypothetical protein